MDARTATSSLVTALSCAIGYGYMDVTRLLLDHAAHDKEKDRDRSLVLYNAVQHNDLPLLQLLLDHGFNVNVGGHTQITALHRAVMLGYDAVVQFLIDNGADVNARDSMMETPIFRTIPGRSDRRDPVRKKMPQSPAEAGADMEVKNARENLGTVPGPIIGAYGIDSV